MSFKEGPRAERVNIIKCCGENETVHLLNGSLFDTEPTILIIMVVSTPYLLFSKYVVVFICDQVCDEANFTC